MERDHPVRASYGGPGAIVSYALIFSSTGEWALKRNRAAYGA